jgi:hypothetical protein
MVKLGWCAGQAGLGWASWAGLRWAGGGGLEWSGVGWVGLGWAGVGKRFDLIQFKKRRNPLWTQPRTSPRLAES